jgi:asparagine N-glycosylation enzyme membrane subunit Stt3
MANNIEKDFIFDNECESNNLIGRSLPYVSAFLIVIDLLLYFGILPSPVSYLLNVIMVVTVICLLPAFVINVLKINKPWIKYFLVVFVSFVLGLANIASQDKMGAI